MARSTSEIYNAIIQEKETFSSLDGLAPSGDNATDLLAELSSGSRVAIWRLWAWVIAYATHVVEVLWDEQKKDLKALATQAVFGTFQWWIGAAKRFQKGDTLVVGDDNQLTYSTTDESKQIIAFAAVQQVGQVAVIKVAKDDGAGFPTPLNTSELQQFSAYIDDIQPVGVAVSATSRASDQLRVNATIYFDSNIAVATIQAAVGEAIDGYLNNLPFNGTVFLTDFVDALQKVDGVIDIVVASIEGKSTGSPNATPFARAYETVAGHIQYDPSNSNLTYIGE